jgi:hypothetical protein
MDNTNLYGGWLGINTVVQDDFGIVTPGPGTISPQPGFGPFNYGVVQAWVGNPTPNPITITYNIVGQATPYGLVQGYNLQWVEYIQPTAPWFTSIVNIIPNGASWGPFNITGTLTILPGQQYTLFVSGDSDIDLTGPGANGGVLLTITQSDVTYNDISNKFLQFRAKYIYDDNQHSVYGAISKLALANGVYDDTIEIDFTDNRLTIPEFVCDIKKVVLACSYDNGLTWYDLKTLDPYLFVGPNRQKYLFDGREVLITVAPSEAILPYHNVPLKSRAQEVVDDRVFYGANLTGYDKIVPDMKFTISYRNYGPQSTIAASQGLLSASHWKRGWEGYIGIVYYDAADRKTAVIIDENNSKIKIPTYNDYQSWDAAVVDYEIYHTPPDWAVKYQFVRTRNLAAVNYLLWIPDYYFVDDDLNPIAPANASYIKFDFNNINYFNENSTLGGKVSLSSVEGDRIRFVYNQGAGTFFPDNEFLIVRSIGNDIYIKNPNWSAISTGAVPGPNIGRWVEIYTPNTNTNDDLYYEFGECYEIGTYIFPNGTIAKYHSTNVVNQSIFPPSPGIGFLETGDVFYRYRSIWYQWNGATWLSNANQIISSTTPSDYTADIFTGNGRPNAENLVEQTYDPVSLIFTDQYQLAFSDFTINGVNAVQPLSITSFNTEFGDLNKLQVINNDILKCIFGNSYQLSVYVNQGIIRQSGATGSLISLSDEVAGNSHIIQRTLGTITPESVKVNDEADMFGWDETEGVVWVSSGNDLIQISDRGLKSSFKQYSNERRATGFISETPAVYDLFHDEYILTLGDITNSTAQKSPRATVVGLPTLANPLSQYTLSFSLQTANTLYYSNTPNQNNIYNILQAQLAPFGFSVVVLYNIQQTQYPLINQGFNFGFGKDWITRNYTTGIVVPQVNPVTWNWAPGNNGVAQNVHTANIPPASNFISLTQTLTGVPIGTVLNITVRVETKTNIPRPAQFVVHTGIGANIQQQTFTAFGAPGSQQTLFASIPLTDPVFPLIGFYSIANTGGANGGPPTLELIEILDVQVFYDVTVNSALIDAPTYTGFAGQSLSIQVASSTGVNNYSFPFLGGQPGSFTVVKQGLTVSYNKQKKGWMTYYSFVPEFYGRVRDYVVSFKNGDLWIHDRNALSKNFYGVQYNRQLVFVSNKDFPKVKDFKAISINGLRQNDLPSIRILPFQGYPNGMFSLLTQRFFKTIEGVQYAYFQKDRLTPGMQSNQVNAMANGRNLKGQVIEITMTNNDTAKSSIYSTEILYFYSEHS